ncbi:type II secretion system F family protein [Mariniluteicoccus flavus]
MTTVWAAACGILVCAGIVACVRGFLGAVEEPRRPGRGWAGLTRRPAGVAGRRRDRRLALGLAVGVLLWALSGWAVAAIIVPLLVVGIPYLLGNPENREVELLAALDRWVRSLAAMLPTGRSVADAVRASVRTAPPLLAAPLSLAVSRLDDRWSTRDALSAMADELDSADADAVLAALMLAAHRGGTGATASLDALSASIADRLRALRDIEAERAKPRVVVRQVTLVSGVMLAACLLMGRDFFAPYATPLGQVVLAGLAVAYVGALAMMRHITAPPKRERILQGVVDERPAGEVVARA